MKKIFSNYLSQKLITRYLILTLSPLFIINLAFSQDQSRQRLNESPRHHEWVKVKYDERTVHSFMVFPEVKDKATAVIVIHENRGLTDWVCSVADQLAEQGYIAIALDLLSGMSPDGGKTSDFADGSAAREAIYQLPPQQVTADLNAVFDYLKKLPAADGKVVVAGFCWGGSQTFRYAINQPGLSAAYVFYGSPPKSKEDVARINCPVYGFYGGNDERVNASIPDITKLMKEAEKVYEPVIYENAGHGFMRSGEAADASDANKKAHDNAWKRWVELLGSL
jgi:carboxymethylenebutenolidase